MAKRDYYMRIEPHSLFKKAVVSRTKDGYLTYSYWRLVECVMERDGLKMNSINWENSEDYVNFNIVSMAPEAFKITYATRYLR